MMINFLVFGYARYEHFYTGKTEKQETIFKEAYNYFKKDYDKGKSRLYYKKQMELKKLKEELERETEENEKGKDENVEKTEIDNDNNKITTSEKPEKKICFCVKY